MTSEAIRSQWFSYHKADAPSKRLWPRVIKSHDEIPYGFHEALSDTYAELPYLIFIPEEQNLLFQQKRNAQMLCLHQDRLVILEAVNDQAVSTTYPFNAIRSVEHGKVLLNSWLTINTAETSKTISFNTVVESVFAPIIKALRLSDAQETSADAVKDQQEVAKLGYLWKKNLKYFNYSKQSLLPGETILESVYQPELRRSALTFFKKPVFRTSLPGHLSILTDNEIIFIKESEKTPVVNNSYGGIATYIPLKQVQRVTFEPQNHHEADSVAIFQLVDGKELRFHYSTKTAENLTAFQEACAQTFKTAQAS